MRYQDWDILLFPLDGPDSNVPFKEFRTCAFSAQDASLIEQGVPLKNTFSPLMTCFVPSVEAGTPFQISVHAWMVQPFHFNSVEKDEKARPHVWHVKVIVDGTLQAEEAFGNDIIWPRVIASAGFRGDGGKPAPLRFPLFHPAVMDGAWTANDERSRIKVEISEGFIEKDKKFVKLTTHAIFNFQTAPMELLQRANIAWPNPRMYDHAVVINGKGKDKLNK